MNRSVFRVLAVSLIVLLATGCKKQAPASSSNTQAVLGTDVTIAFYDPGLTAEKTGPLFKEAFDILANWDRIALKPGPDNQIARITQGAGVQSVSVDDAVFEMLTKALKFYDVTNKTFDIRYGPMLDLWGFDKDPHVPTAAQLDSVKSLVATGGLFVAGHSILLAKKGMRFDVREIVVGHAFDMAAAKLAEKGVRTAMISSSRVCRTIGDPPTPRGFPWLIASPLSMKGPWGTLWVPVGGAAYASRSGERFQSNGKWYYNLLDPRTGNPADKCMATMVQSADAATAQALAYATFVWGSIDSIDAAGKSAAYGTVIVGLQGEVLKPVTRGSLTDHFETLK
jgi:FAD:protein FMN transferase